MSTIRVGLAESGGRQSTLWGTGDGHDPIRDTKIYDVNRRAMISYGSTFFTKIFLFFFTGLFVNRHCSLREKSGDYAHSQRVPVKDPGTKRATLP